MSCGYAQAGDDTVHSAHRGVGRRVSDKPTCLCASEGTFVRGAASVRMAGVILTARSVHRVFPLAVPRSVAHNI